jgi:hypothetical protein
LASYTVKENMRRSGYTSIAVGLALEGLLRKEMIEYYQDTNYNGETYTACRLTGKGIDWLLASQDRFRMRKDEGKRASTPISDEDIPF